MRVVGMVSEGGKEERVISGIMVRNAERDRREKVRGINCAIKKRSDNERLAPKWREARF